MNRMNITFFTHLAAWRVTFSLSIPFLMEYYLSMLPSFFKFLIAVSASYPRSLPRYSCPLFDGNILTHFTHVQTNTHRLLYADFSLGCYYNLSPATLDVLALTTSDKLKTPRVLLLKTWFWDICWLADKVDVVFGEWVNNLTAGGQISHNSFIRNPQYGLSIAG